MTGQISEQMMGMENDNTNLSNAEGDVEKVIMLWAGVHKSRGKITRNLVLTLKLKTKYKIAALFILPNNYDINFFSTNTSINNKNELQ